MKDSFINSRGLEVFCLPVAAEYTKSISDNIEAAYLERGEPIKPPVRFIPKMGGGTLPEPLTNFNLDDLTEEEKEKLAAHLEALNRMGNDKLLALVNAYSFEGVKLDEVPLAWVKRQKLIGNPIPVDKDELRLQYVKSELIVTFPMGSEEEAADSDFSKLSETCQGLAFKGLSKEAEAAWRDRFRGRAGRPQNGADNTALGPENGAGGALLGDEPGDVGGSDSGELRPASELV